MSDTKQNRDSLLNTMLLKDKKCYNRISEKESSMLLKIYEGLKKYSGIFAFEIRNF